MKIRRDVSPAFQITERTKICSLNFKITDFRVTLTGRRYLKDDAIPSIFSWSAASPKRKSPRKRTPSHSIAHDQKPSCSSKNERNSESDVDQISELRTHIAELK